jgi:hypothetical protein
MDIGHLPAGGNEEIRNICKNGAGLMQRRYALKVRRGPFDRPAA